MLHITNRVCIVLNYYNDYYLLVHGQCYYPHRNNLDDWYKYERICISDIIACISENTILFIFIYYANGSFNGHY